MKFSTAKKLIKRTDVPIDEKFAIAKEIDHPLIWEMIEKIIKLKNLNQTELLRLGNQFSDNDFWVMVFKTCKIDFRIMLKLCEEYQKKKMNNSGMLKTAFQTKLVPRNVMMQIIKKTHLIYLCKTAIQTNLFAVDELLEIDKFINDNTITAFVNQKL